jgi:hypothetical protein
MRIRSTGTFTSFFKDKKSQRSYKTVEIKVFLSILLDDRRIRSRILTCDKRIRMRIWEDQKNWDPIDADSEHWYIYIILDR